MCTKCVIWLELCSRIWHIYHFLKYHFGRFQSLSMLSQSYIFVSKITMIPMSFLFPIISYHFRFRWKIVKVKKKIIWASPIVFENYHIFGVFYRILHRNIVFTYNASSLVSIFLEYHIYICIESWLICPNPWITT